MNETSSKPSGFLILNHKILWWANSFLTLCQIPKNYILFHCKIITYLLIWIWLWFYDHFLGLPFYGVCIMFMNHCRKAVCSLILAFVLLVPEAAFVQASEPEESAAASAAEYDADESSVYYEDGIPFHIQV